MVTALTVSACGKNSTDQPTSPEPQRATISKDSASESKPNTSSLPGPFGLAKGISADRLIAEFRFKQLDGASGAYEGSPPKPVEGITEYLAVATKESGLCKIIASTPTEPANDSGDQVKSTVDRLAESLKIKYGDHVVKTSYVGTGMFQRNPDMWMIGLKEESVVYAYTWENKTAPLPNDLDAVEISATAVGSSKAYAKIVYTFNNFSACLREMKAAKAQNL